jgi:hypothetical protein
MKTRANRNHPVRKNARRERAKDRFNIYFHPRIPLNIALNDPAYAGYVDRKIVEAKALGLVPKNVNTLTALKLLG